MNFIHPHVSLRMDGVLIASVAAFLVGCAMIVVAEWSLPNYSYANVVVTVAGLMGVILGIRGVVTDPVVGAVNPVVDIGVVLVVQILLGLLVFIAIQHAVRLRTADQPPQA